MIDSMKLRMEKLVCVLLISRKAYILNNDMILLFQIDELKDKFAKEVEQKECLIDTIKKEVCKHVMSRNDYSIITLMPF